MKRFRRLVSFLLICVMLFSMTALAAEARASTRITSTTATISVKSDGDLKIRYVIVATGTMDTLGASSIKIERYNGSKWVTEYTYTVANTSDLQTSNAIQYSNTLTHTPEYTGTSYRAVVSFIAKDSSGTSTKESTTSSVAT